VRATQSRSLLTPPTGTAPSIRAMKAMFYAYLIVIASGIGYFTVIGLAHH
jgi:hypothetical protein